MTNRTSRTPQRRTPNSLGTIRRERSGRYSALYRHGDTTFRAPRTFETREGAEAWLGRERSDRHLGIWKDPRQAQDTLADFTRGWLNDRRDLALRTRDLYEHVAGRWLLNPVTGVDDRMDLGALPLGALTPAVVRRWHALVTDVAHAAAVARETRSAARQGNPARIWATERGYTVAPTGRLSPGVIAAWQAAGGPTPERPEAAIATERRDAGRTQAAHAFRLLRAVLNTAVGDGIIDHNPAVALRGAGTVHHRERGTASPAEVGALADAFPPHLHAAVILAAWSGLRFGELFGLARKHVDLTAGTVRVERALVIRSGRPASFGDPKTAKSRRTVHLPAFVVDELRHHLAHHVPIGPEQLVFTSAAGTPVTSALVSRLMGRARATIGRDDLTWHDLRHTSALAAYQVGASQRAVMDRLGHSTTRAAAIYAHAAENADAALAARMDQLMRGAGKN